MDNYFPAEKKQIEQLYRQMKELERQYMQDHILQWLSGRYGQPFEVRADQPATQTSLALCELLIETQTASKVPLWAEFSDGKQIALVAVIAQEECCQLSLALIEPDGSFQVKTCSPTPALQVVFEEKEIKIYTYTTHAPLARIFW